MQNPLKTVERFMDECKEDLGCVGVDKLFCMLSCNNQKIE